MKIRASELDVIQFSWSVNEFHRIDFGCKKNFYGKVNLLAISMK